MRTEIGGRTFIHAEATKAARAQWYEVIRTVAGTRWVKVRPETIEKAAQDERDYADYCEVQDSQEMDLWATGRR